jgi:hypothetical protein
MKRLAVLRPKLCVDAGYAEKYPLRARPDSGPKTEISESIWLVMKEVFLPLTVDLAIVTCKRQGGGNSPCP